MASLQGTRNHRCITRSFRQFATLIRTPWIMTPSWASTGEALRNGYLAGGQSPHLARYVVPPLKKLENYQGKTKGDLSHKGRSLKTDLIKVIQISTKRRLHDAKTEACSVILAIYIIKKCKITLTIYRKPLRVLTGIGWPPCSSQYVL